MRAHGDLGRVGVLVFCGLLGGCGWVLGLDEYSMDEHSGVQPCDDGVRNGSETDVDCGGSCGPCAAGSGCVTGTDCESLVCVSGLCRAPACNDSTTNGSETDEDCGGTGCAPCEDERSCIAGGDCKSGVCSAGTCQVATCEDSVRNASETDSDCGGDTCPECAPGGHCDGATDCLSAICEGSECIDHHIWSKSFGDPTGQTAYQIVVDSKGNIFVLGDFQGTVDLGGGPMTNPCPMEEEYCLYQYDSFIAKLDIDGKHLWSKRIVNAGALYFDVKLALDGSDNVLLLAYADGNVDLGGGAPPNPNQDGGVDVFVAKLGNDGDHLWTKRYGGAGSQFGYGIAGNSSGAFVLTGAFGDTIDFGGGTLTSAGSYDVFVAKLDQSGKNIWSKRFGEATNAQYGKSIATDEGGNVLVSGYFNKSVSFGGPTLTSVGGTDLFLVKLNSIGDHVWSKKFGDINDQEDSRVSVDASGNVILVGTFTGDIDFGGGPLTSAGEKDLFIAKFDPSGKLLWSHRFGGSQNETVGGANVDDVGNIVITGSFKDAVDFGGVPLEGEGDLDLYIVKLKPSGDHLWSKRFGDADLQSGNAIAAHGAQGVVAAGGFGGTVDFGGGVLKSAGKSDLFIAKLRTP